MKNVIKILPLALLTAACGGGNDDTDYDDDYGSEIMGADAEDGSATLALAGETYDLNVDICPKAKDAFSNDVEQNSMHNGMASNSDETAVLNVQGLKSSRGDQSKEEASFSISLNGGVIGGGTSYKGEMPFSAFEGANVSFKGNAQDISATGAAGAEVPVEFSIDCG